MGTPARPFLLVHFSEPKPDGRGVHPTSRGQKGTENKEPRSKRIGVLVLSEVVNRDANSAAQCFSIGGPIGSLRSVMTGQLRAISALRAV